MKKVIIILLILCLGLSCVSASIIDFNGQRLVLPESKVVFKLPVHEVDKGKAALPKPEGTDYKLLISSLQLQIDVQDEKINKLEEENKKLTELLCMHDKIFCEGLTNEIIK